MKKTVVAYRSLYGSTQKYAEWIAAELGCDIKNTDKDKVCLEDYDIIIFGGGLYAGRVSGMELLISSFEKIKDKKLILFTCGLADPNIGKNRENIISGINKVFTEEMRKNIKVFCFRGGIDYSRLSLVHKAMMSMMYRMILKKSKKTDLAMDENREFIESYGKAVDFTDKSSIEPLIIYAKDTPEKEG